MEGSARSRPAKSPTPARKQPENTGSEPVHEYGAQQQPRKTACVACRKRKVRCDGKKPICGTCARLDKMCAYHEVEMKTPSCLKTETGGMPQSSKTIGAHLSESPKSKTASRSSHVNMQLQEWIDGNTVHSSAQIAGDVGFAEIYFNTCLATLQRIWRYILHYPDILTYREKKTVKESLSRLILWIDGFESGTLDRILDRAEDLRENVFQLINDIAKPLAYTLLPLILKVAGDQLGLVEHSRLESIMATTYELQSDIRNVISLNENFKLIIFNGASQDESDVFTSDDDSETALNSTTSSIFDISSASKRLMELLPSLEKSTAASQERRIENGTLLPVPFKASGPASYFISHVMDKFREADISLAERLGEANWQRHERIRSQIEMIVNGSELPAPRDDVVANSVFKPFSMFHDSGIGTSRPAESSYAISNASHSSFLTTLTQKSSGSFRVPELPEGATYGEAFKCEICGHVLSKIKNRIDWKHHVFADLQPYICTWTNCRDELTTFPTRRLWANHEFEKHRMKPTWRCYECSADLASPDDLKAHLRSIHQIRFSDSQLAIAASTAKINQPLSVKDMKCPLCLGHAGDTRRAFQNHVGKHMEEIALASLPRDAAVDLDPEPEESRLGSSSSILSADLERPQYSAFTDEENMLISRMASDMAKSTPGAEMDEIRSNLQNIAQKDVDPMNELQPRGEHDLTQDTQKSQPQPAALSQPQVQQTALGTTGRQSRSQSDDSPPSRSNSPHGNFTKKFWESEFNDGRLYSNYKAQPQPDRNYHCPYATQTGCDHRPTPLKTQYDKYLDSHLGPYRCRAKNAPQCANVRFSSTAGRLRHEREAHGLHGHGKMPHLCEYPGCDRGQHDNGFARRWNLYNHMKRVHDWTAPADEAQAEVPAKRDYKQDLQSQAPLRRSVAPYPPSPEEAGSWCPLPSIQELIEGSGYSYTDHTKYPEFSKQLPPPRPRRPLPPTPPPAKQLQEPLSRR